MHEIFFKTLTKPLLAGHIQLQSTWPDITAILVFISFGIATIAFFACIYLVFKVRRLTTIILIMHQVYLKQRLKLFIHLFFINPLKVKILVQQSWVLLLVNFLGFMQL